MGNAKERPPFSLLIVLALAAGFLLGASGLSSSLAQGSAGGSIGKRGKSAAGEEAAPVRRAAPRQEKRRAKRTPERAPRAAATGEAAARPVARGCERAIGSWLWFNSGTVVLKPGGAMSAGGPITGTWRCEGEVVVITGPFWVDRLTLSADGNSMSGTSALGLAVSGKRM
jgi:hypothetical protein